MVDPSKLHNALLKAKIVIARWLETTLLEIDADFWKNCVLPKVSYNQKLHIDQRRLSKLSQLDLAVLLRVFDKNWDAISYKCNFEVRIRNYLHEVQDIRNTYSHLSDYPPMEDFVRDVDTLHRFLLGIGIDKAFCDEVKKIGKDPEPILEVDEHSEVSGVSAQQSKEVNLAEYYTDLSIVLKPTKDYPVKDMAEHSNTSSTNIDLKPVKVLQRNPFCPGASLVKTKMRNAGVSGFSTVVDVIGEDARTLYFELANVSSVPELSGISSAIVATRDAGDDTSLLDAKTTLDFVLAGDRIEGFTPCVVQESPEARLVWFLGEQRKDSMIAVPTIKVPNEVNPFSIALPNWWSKMAKEQQFKVLKPLSLIEVQKTICLSEKDLWRYMKTYAPRSYAEAFYLVRKLPCELLNSILEPKAKISILDVGCGVGGAVIGVLDALAVEACNDCQTRVVALDGNEAALKLMAEFLKTRSLDSLSYIDTTRDVMLSQRNIKFIDEVNAPAHNKDKFNIIIASKSIGEDRSISFVDFLEYSKEHLYEKGVVILIEVLKHEELISKAIASLKLPKGCLSHLSVRVGTLGSESPDNEEVVVCTIHKNMFK